MCTAEDGGMTQGLKLSCMPLRGCAWRTAAVFTAALRSLVGGDVTGSLQEGTPVRCTEDIIEAWASLGLYWAE